MKDVRAKNDKKNKEKEEFFRKAGGGKRSENGKRCKGEKRV